MDIKVGDTVAVAVGKIWGTPAMRKLMAARRYTVVAFISLKGYDFAELQELGRTATCKVPAADLIPVRK